jgi:hypothetical protein
MGQNRVLADGGRYIMAQLRIFVSHSSHDNAWCRPFADALKAVGYDVWYDETGLQGGAAWVASIQHEVENRDIFLLVLTPEAWESKWVQDELQLAIATRRRVLPVLLRNTQISGFLLTTQWITVVGEEPQAAARATIMAIEAPPAPGRNAAPVATTETLEDLITLCRSLAAEKRYSEALSVCGRSLVLDPDNNDVLHVNVDVLIGIGEVERAATTYWHLLSLQPYHRILPYSWEWGVNVAIINGSADPGTIVEAYRDLRLRGGSPDLLSVERSRLYEALASALYRLAKLGQSHALVTLAPQICELRLVAMACNLLLEDEQVDAVMQLAMRLEGSEYDVAEGRREATSSLRQYREFTDHVAHKKCLQLVNQLKRQWSNQNP